MNDIKNINCQHSDFMECYNKIYNDKELPDYIFYLNHCKIFEEHDLFFGVDSRSINRRNINMIDDFFECMGREFVYVKIIEAPFYSFDSKCAKGFNNCLLFNIRESEFSKLYNIIDENLDMGESCFYIFDPLCKFGFYYDANCRVILFGFSDETSHCVNNTLGNVPTEVKLHEKERIYEIFEDSFREESIKKIFDFYFHN